MIHDERIIHIKILPANLHNDSILIWSYPLIDIVSLHNYINKVVQLCIEDATIQLM